MNLSGARVEVFPSFVVKHRMGHTEFRGQLEKVTFLPHMPKVFFNWDSGYIMERLQPVPNIVGLHGVINIMLVQLGDIWKLPAEQNENWVVLLHHWLLSRGWGSFLDDFNEVTARVQNKPGCMVHGDPTYDNVMFRPIALDECYRGGRFVFIDPLPDREYLPANECVDYAKLGQSVCGWESFIGKAHPVPADMQRRLWKMLSYYCPDLYWWTALAFARIMARSTDESIRGFCRMHITSLLTERRPSPVSAVAVRIA